jgi:hypothetical protein
LAFGRHGWFRQCGPVVSVVVRPAASVKAGMPSWTAALRRVVIWSLHGR